MLGMLAFPAQGVKEADLVGAWVVEVERTDTVGTVMQGLGTRVWLILWSDDRRCAYVARAWRRTVVDGGRYSLVD